LHIGLSLLRSASAKTKDDEKEKYRLKRKAPAPSQIRAAVHTLLRDPGYRHAARGRP
jgi:hypothetical protein